MNADQLDDAYTTLCHNIDAVGEQGTSLYLARVAMLLILESEPSVVKAALQAALPTPKGRE
ncbi:hypothetical protein [Chitinasiproducens palmae]|uniref:DUF2783 domain-containing protein n=1 Tax=Chitinasiproducens palmae TaxID=1770053 RepID=A0A1H2PRH7_9BURK|nr:hypothetical protein [Chitinasiproducens palmae]SDV49057.1 hypothetical protein SAMN05216551_10727 [Chitinasiproducens palmae]